MVINKWILVDEGDVDGWGYVDVIDVLVYDFLYLELYFKEVSNVFVEIYC